VIDASVAKAVGVKSRHVEVAHTGIFAKSINSKI
jgi:hypothetical protein